MEEDTLRETSSCFLSGFKQAISMYLHTDISAYGYMRTCPCSFVYLTLKTSAQEKLKPAMLR